MKKIILLIFAVLMVISISACDLFNNNAQNDNENSNNQGTTEKPSGEKGTSDPSLKNIRNAVAEVYGKDYKADTEMNVDYISKTFGISKEHIEDAYGEYPSISGFNHMFIGIKAKSGYGKEIEKSLKTYFEEHEKDEGLSEVDKYRAASAEIYRNGDYVFYVRLGKDFDKTVTDEKEKKSFIDKQIEIGIEKVKTFFE